MRKLYPALVIFAGLCHPVAGQSQSAAPNAAARSQTIGRVTAVDVAARRLILQDDRGAAVAVSAAETVPVLRVPPGETDLKKATRIAFTEIGSGDRVLAVGVKSDDGKEVQARTLVVMSQADLAQKQQRERQDWQTRGISGTVTALDPASRTLTVKIGAKVLTVQTGNQTEYRRYAPDSIQFSDAVASSFTDIRTGDQIRALGNKNGDGSSLVAEQVVSGSFRQLAGTIITIRAEAHEVRINDLASKKPVVITVNSSSVIKRLSPQVSAALSRRFRPGAGANASAPANPGREDLGQVLDRLPSVALSDLKPGDALMISGSAGSDAGRLTAINILAGVEPLLTASPDAARDIMAGWNFGGEGGQE